MVKGFGLPLPRQTLFKYVRGFSPNHMLDVDRNLIEIWSQKCTCERARQIGVARGGMCCLFSFFCCSCSACVLVFVFFPPPSLFPPLFFPTAKSGGDRRSMIRRHTHIGFNRPPTSRIGSLMKKAMASAKKKYKHTPTNTRGYTLVTM